jgi:hypothetical protein
VQFVAAGRLLQRRIGAESGGSLEWREHHFDH